MIINLILKTNNKNHFISKKKLNRFITDKYFNLFIF